MLRSQDSSSTQHTPQCSASLSDVSFNSSNILEQFADPHSSLHSNAWYEPWNPPSSNGLNLTHASAQAGMHIGTQTCPSCTLASDACTTWKGCLQSIPTKEDFRQLIQGRSKLYKMASTIWLIEFKFLSFPYLWQRRTLICSFSSLDRKVGLPLLSNLQQLAKILLCLVELNLLTFHFLHVA